MIYRLGHELPEIDGYVAHSAQIIGKVRILQNASVWMGAVLRGDIEQIVLGRSSNVQENSSLHTSPRPAVTDRRKTSPSATVPPCTVALLAILA